jgi:AcrR family transcriptional regulator
MPRLGTRERILRAAMQAFAKNGTSATTKAIAKSAKCSEPTIFRLFVSKHRLYREAFREAANRNPMIPYLRSVLATDPVPPLNTVMGEVARIVVEDDSTVYRLIITAALQTPSLYVEWERDPNRISLYPLMADYITRLKAQDGFPDVDPSEAGRWLVGTIYNLFLRNVLFKGTMADEDPVLVAQHMMSVAVGELARR